MAILATASAPLAADRLQAERAARAAIHPITQEAELRAWLAKVPLTRDWPPDFAETLAGQAPVLVIEMSTRPNCLPCADLWRTLGSLARRYRLTARTIDEREAMVRSGKLGLPWAGHPVAWVRPISDTNRSIPIAIGTDHAANLARNIYLAAKMLAGVRPAVGVRAMAKFTGIVGGREDRKAPKR